MYIYMCVFVTLSHRINVKDKAPTFTKTNQYVL